MEWLDYCAKKIEALYDEACVRTYLYKEKKKKIKKRALLVKNLLR